MQKQERDTWKPAFACWICGFPTAETTDHNHPLRKSVDHVGKKLKCAHRWCNSKRGSRDTPLTESIVFACRNHMVSVHGEWLRSVGVTALRTEQVWRSLELHRWDDDGGQVFVHKAKFFTVP